MNIAFFNGVSGMIAFGRNMDMVSNNIANVNTVGYKKTTGSFVDLIYSRIDTNVEGDHMVGHGTKNDYTDVVFEQGALNLTDNPLDFAIVGEGFFAVEQEDGTRAYTRDGSFAIGLVGTIPYLTTSSGQYLLDEKGSRIRLPMIEGTNQVDTSKIGEKIGVFRFQNPYGIMPIGNNLYVQTLKSGQPIGGSKGSGGIGGNELIQGSLEFSSVNTADEMVEMMQTQRGFSLASKMIQASDQMEEIINNLR